MPRRACPPDNRRQFTMKSIGRFLTFATLTVGCSLIAIPSAMACGACGTSIMTQPAVIQSTTLASPVVDTSIVQPAVVDNSCSTVLTQPAVIDNSCNTCGTVLTQPAVLAAPSCNTCGTVLTQPAVIGYRRFHRHLFDLGTPFMNFSLF